MFAEPDMNILQKDPWQVYRERCNGQNYWFSSPTGNCSLLSKSLDFDLREQILDCYGLEEMKKMEDAKFNIIHFPFAAKSISFLNLIWKMNRERDLARLLRLDYLSAIKSCTKASMNVAAFELGTSVDCCKEGLEFGNLTPAISKKIMKFPNKEINFETQIEAYNSGKSIPSLSNSQISDIKFVRESCLDQEGELKKRRQEEEKKWRERNRVQFGDNIRFYHNTTGLHLHSHEQRYYTGSRQQQVTCNLGHEFDKNDYWEFRSAREKGEEDSSNFVKDGAKLFLFHKLTESLLFSSTGFESPKTKQQEVSCVPQSMSSGETEWLARTVQGEAYVDFFSEIHLQHTKTGCFLKSHKVLFPIFEGGEHQQEVTCVPNKSEDTVWVVFRGKLKEKFPIE